MLSHSHVDEPTLLHTPLHARRGIIVSALLVAAAVTASLAGTRDVPERLPFSQLTTTDRPTEGSLQVPPATLETRLQPLVRRRQPPLELRRRTHTVTQSLSLDVANPRVGICIVGDARLLHVTWPSMITNVLDALQPDPRRRVVVVDVATDSQCVLHTLGQKRCRAEARYAQSELLNESSTLRRSITAEADINIVNNFTCQHPFLTTPAGLHQCCAKDANAMDLGKGVLGMARYMRRRLCYEHLKEREVETGVPFDFIATVRADVLVLEPLPPATFFLSLRPRVFGMSRGDSTWGDGLLMSSRAMADHMHDSLDTVFRQPCGDNWANYRGQIPEERLTTLMQNFVENQLWPIHAVLVFDEKTAECSALRNNLLDARWLKTDVDGDLLVQQSPRCNTRFPTQPLEVTSAPSDPRVGFCVAGGIRTLGITWPSIVSNLIDALQPDPNKRHVALEVTTRSDCDANYHNGGRLKVLCEEQVAQTARMLLDNTSSLRQQMGPDVTVNVENEFHCGHPFVKDHACCTLNPNSMNNQGGYWGMTQYMRRRLCYDRLKSHEQRTGQKFDFIVVTRPDFYYFEPLPPASYFASLPPRVFAMTKADAWGDYLFMMVRDLADQFDDRVDSVFRNPCAARGDLGASPEYRLGPDLEHGFVHQQWPVHGCVARGDKVADCGRLNNDIIQLRIPNSQGVMTRETPTCTARFPGFPPGTA